MRRDDGAPDPERPALGNAGPPVDEPFRRVQVALVDLAEPVPAIAADTSGGEPYQRVATYVRWSGIPVGVAWTDVPPRGLDAAAHARSIWSQLGPALQSAAGENGEQIASLPVAGLGASPGRQPDGSATPHVTVIIATHDRAQLLDRCLQSLLAGRYPAYDVLVVDNAPSSDATARLVASNYRSDPVAYVREDRPGLAAAHNRGLDAARGELVAFTDDDVTVDPHWLTTIVAAFEADPAVSCVTGMILPMQLDTRAQWWLEGYAGFAKGFATRSYNLAERRPNDPLFPYTAGRLGSGANMAFRKQALLDIGGFDPALGTGSGAYGGDDLAAFFEIICRGHTLTYQPGAIVHHQHPATEEQLRRQVFGYGAGLTAYLTHTVVSRPRRLLTLATKAPYAVWYALSSRSDRNSRRAADFPRSLRLRELAGMAIGPAAYLTTRRRLKSGER